MVRIQLEVQQRSGSRRGFMLRANRIKPPSHLPGGDRDQRRGVGRVDEKRQRRSVPLQPL
jgi:hypothetical protein